MEEVDPCTPAGEEGFEDEEGEEDEEAPRSLAAAAADEKVEEEDEEDDEVDLEAPRPVVEDEGREELEGTVFLAREERMVSCSLRNTATFSGDTVQGPDPSARSSWVRSAEYAAS